VSPLAAEAAAAAAAGDLSSSSSSSAIAAAAAAVLVPYTPLLDYAKSVVTLSSERFAAYSGSSDQTASMQQEPLLSAVLPSLAAALVVLPLARRVKGLLCTQLLPYVQALVRSCDALLPLTAAAESDSTTSSGDQSTPVGSVLTADVSGVWHLHSEAADTIPAQDYTLQLQRQESSTSTLSNCYELQGTGEGGISDVAVHGAVSGLRIKFLEVWTEGGTCEVDARLSPDGSFMSGSFCDTWTGTRGSITGHRTEVQHELAHSALAQLSSLQVVLATLAGKLATCLITGVEIRYAEGPDFISRDDAAVGASSAAASTTAKASAVSPARSVSPVTTAAATGTTAGVESSAVASTEAAAAAGLAALLTQSEDEDDEESEDSSEVSDDLAEQVVEAVEEVSAAVAAPAAVAVTAAVAAVAPTAATATSAAETQLAVRYATATRLFAGGMWSADAAPHVAATLEYCLPESSRTAEQIAWVAAVFAQSPQMPALPEHDSSFYAALKQGAAPVTAATTAATAAAATVVVTAAAAIDKWVSSAAGASPMMKLGGEPMAVARRAAVAALLLHTGMLPRLLLEWEHASSSSSSSGESAADADGSTAAATTAKPSEPIVQIWRAARQVSTFFILR
jgi:hypothetical protein